MPKCVSVSKLLQYADDTTLLSRLMDHQNSVPIHQRDTLLVMDWFLANRINDGFLLVNFVAVHLVNEHFGRYVASLVNGFNH